MKKAFERWWKKTSILDSHRAKEMAWKSWQSGVIWIQNYQAKVERKYKENKAALKEADRG